MTSLQLAHHLLWLFAHCPSIRHLLLTWYRTQLPSEPHGWYAQQIRWYIGYYPHAAQACVRLLQHHARLVTLRNYCP